jgi:hypothetical protein
MLTGGEVESRQGAESDSGQDEAGGGCCGVQLDEWKLALGFGSTITIHDIRTAGL